MRFQTGDVAEFMEMTNMGVIYLEKRGIVQARREANGYRSFDLETITRLGIIRSYEKMGFTLEEAADLVSQTSKGVLEAVEEKKGQLQRQLDMIRFLEEAVRPTLQDTMEGRELVITTMPEMYYCPLWEDKFDMDALPPETQRLMRRIDVSWLSAMPYMRYCSKMTWDGKQWHMERGNCIRSDHAREQGVLLDDTWVERIPAQKCLQYYAVAERNKLEHCLEEGMAYLKKLGLEWGETAYLPLDLRYSGMAPQRYGVCIYLPIQSETVQKENI